MAPLYAILNYMASIYAAYDLAAAADLGTGTKALALQTASTIYSRAISGEAVVGYLAMSIPFIAWAALKRMENFGTALVGGLSGLQAMIAGGTSAATVGNVSWGNVGMDQIHLAPNRTSAFMSSWQHDLSGNTFSSNVLTGRTAVSLLRNQGYASRVVSLRVSEQDMTDASRQVAAARNEAVAANHERAAVLSESFSRGLAALKSSHQSDSTTSSSFEQWGETLNRLDQITKSVADTTGLSQAQVARIALGAAGHLGISTPVAGIQGNASVDKNYSSNLTSEEQKILGSITSEQLAEFKQFGDRVSRDKSFASILGNETRDGREMAARLASTTARSERAEASLAERTAFAERLATAYERGETLSIDIAQDPHNLEMFLRYAEQYGGNSAAARALMEAELARQSLKPNRTFSDGTAVPVSFGDLQTHHALDAADPALDPELRARHRQQVEELRRFGMSGTTAPPPPSKPSPLRQEVQERANHLRSATAADQAAFEEKTEIIPTWDGTLATKRSLVKQTAQQVKEDAGSVIDDAQQAVRDALRK